MTRSRNFTTGFVAIAAVKLSIWPPNIHAVVDGIHDCLKRMVMMRKSSGLPITMKDLPSLDTMVWLHQAEQRLTQADPDPLRNLQSDSVAP